MTYGEVKRAILLVAVLYLAFQFIGAVTAILFLFFAVFLFAMALNPVVTWLQRRRVPRAVGAGLIALVALGVLSLVGWLVIPPMIAEARAFIIALPDYWQAIQTRAEGLAARVPFLRGRVVEGAGLTRDLARYAQQALAQLGQYTLTAATAIGALVLLFILTIYTLAKPRPLVAGLLGAVPEPYRGPTRTALVRIAGQARAWVVASLLLGAIVAVLVWLGLALLGVPNALLLASLAFLGEFVPNFGPLAAAIPAVLVGFAVSPLTALWVVILYLVIQQVEAQLLTPLVMGGRLELHPVSIAFFILVMTGLIGIVGALLAVPIAATAKILYEEFFYKPRHPDEDDIRHDADDVIAA
ncbi:MAG: AI-2E family transporter [Armatimonadetes bacterium]|nr:AI-2E family transporter [Armatimonadota bacterium]